VRVILVVLALIWVVALTPIALRKLREREGSYSVARFHRSLRAMRRAFPRQVAAAGAGSGGMAFFGDQHLARRVGVHAAGRPRPPASGTGNPAAEVGAQPATVSAARPVARTPGTSVQRRRQVLATLAGGLVLTFLFGLVPALRPMWDVSLLLLALTAGYVALLIHFRRVAVERAEKVVFLEPAAAPADSVTAQIPRVQPYRPGQAPAPFRAAAGVRLATRPQAVRPRPAVVGG
jgi:hypothetical protein